MLVAQLPASLLQYLVAPLDKPDSSNTAFLECLSDGQLLCLAFNSAIAQSSRRWAFIPTEQIHDLISLTAQQPTSRTSLESRRAPSELSESGDSARIGLTFRRLENLRLFLAALRLRYGVSLLPSHQREKGTSKDAGAEAVEVDLKVVSRKDPGWEAMMERIVFSWTRAVVNETLEHYASRERS